MTEGKGRTESATTRRANELVSFTTADNFNTFVQNYRGDVCSSSASKQPMAVTVHISCGGCRRNAAANHSGVVGGINGEWLPSSVSSQGRSRAFERPADLEVCHVAMLGECVFSLSISLQCPSKESSLPVSLDVGTATRLSDIVSAGVVSSAWRLGAVGGNVSPQAAPIHALRGTGWSRSIQRRVFYLSLRSGIIDDIDIGSNDRSIAWGSISSSRRLHNGSGAAEALRPSPEKGTLISSRLHSSFLSVGQHCRKKGATLLHLSVRIRGFQRITFAWRVNCA